MEIKKDILWRVYICFIAMMIVSIAIIGKAFYIQQVQGAYWQGISDSMHTHVEEIDADRGTIYSEDGEMLSTSVPQFDIYIDFAAEYLRNNNGKVFSDNVDSLSICLSNLFKDKTAAEYKSLLKKGYRSKNRYFSLMKKVNFEQYQQMKNFPLIRLGRNKSGFIAETKNIRLNPYQMLAFRTIGLERQNSQKIGLEQSYDTTLKGTTGKRLVRYIAGGVPVPVNENEDFDIEPKNGNDVITTLDTHIQEVAENALMKIVSDNEAMYGCAVVMETETGKIKAIANLGRRPDGTYWEDYNYAMRATEPGSTIKLATLLSVLDNGAVNVNDMVEVGSAGHAFVGVRDVNDAERAPKPIMSVKECFAHSSNVGMSKIAYKSFASQPDKFLKYLHTYHMDSITGIDLKGEGKPILPKISRSNEGLHAMVTMSFGYAIQVTPLQTLTLYNAVANNGRMMKPYLVSSIQSNGAVIQHFEPVVLRDSICKPSTIKAAQESMHMVTTEGTAKAVFKDFPFPVAGKTGTAHVADGTYGYDDGVYQASFVGYFPANKPKYTCIVVVKTKPFSALHFGGQLAAPVFKEIALRLMTTDVRNADSTAKFLIAKRKDSVNYMYAGMQDDIKYTMQKIGLHYADSSRSNDGYAKVYRGNAQPVVVSAAMPKKNMPSLNGLGLKDALYICENMGLKVRVNGMGKVISQSVNAGTVINKGQTVTIELN